MVFRVTTNYVKLKYTRLRFCTVFAHNKTAVYQGTMYVVMQTCAVYKYPLIDIEFCLR